MWSGAWFVKSRSLTGGSIVLSGVVGWAAPRTPEALTGPLKSGLLRPLSQASRTSVPAGQGHRAPRHPTSLVPQLSWAPREAVV